MVFIMKIYKNFSYESKEDRVWKINSPTDNFLALKKLQLGKIDWQMVNMMRLEIPLEVNTYVDTNIENISIEQKTIEVKVMSL